MAEIPPVYVQFKGDTSDLNVAIGKAKGQLTSFSNTAKETTNTTKKLGVAQIALGGIIANVATQAAASAKTFAMSFIGEYQAIAGEVRTLSRVMDGTPEQLSVIAFAAKRFGVDASGLSLSLRVLSRNLSQNNKTAQSLGIQYRDANGRLLPTIDILYKLADRFKEMPTKMDQTAFAMAAFGRQGGKLAPLLGLGSEGIKELGLSAQELGMVMSGADLEAVKNYGYAQKDLKNAIDGVKVTIGRDLLPVLSSAAQGLNETLLPALKTVASAFSNSGLGGGIRQAQDSLQGFILGLDGVKQAIYQVILMIGSYKVAMVIFRATPAIMAAVTASIKGVQTALAFMALLAKHGGTAFTLMSAQIKTALISTGIGIFIVAIGALVAALTNAYLTSETFRNRVNGFFTSIAQKALVVVNYVIRLYNVFAKLLGLKSLDLVSFNSGSAQLSENAGQKGSGQTGASGAGGAGAYVPPADNSGASGTPKKTAFEKFKEQQQAALAKAQAKLSLALALTSDPKKENELQQAYKAQVKTMYDRAVAAEKAARGTKGHAAAQAYLNEITGTYASAIESANAAQKAYNDSIANSNKLTQAQIDAQNRLYRAMQRNRQASRSFLAAQALSSGPTQANFGGFIEVPVVIDGQVVFRATQRYSLINNLRNVTNGLATSGSLI